MPESSVSPRPLLVIVHGKPGAGKTTLARRLAREDALGLSLPSRDAIKSGLVETHGIETDEVRTRVAPLAFDLFYRTIDLWLRAGVSLIAEEALRSYTQVADLAVLACDTSDEEASRRYIERERANLRKRQDALATTIAQMRPSAYP